MKKIETYAYALLRIMAGAMFAFDGGRVLTVSPPRIGSQMWIGGLIELFGGLAVMLGLGARLAAFLCSGMMAVAYVQFHWKMRFDADFFPAVNQGELAVLYCFVFLLISCQGSGRWSLGGK